MRQKRTVFEEIWDGESPSRPIFRSDKHGIQVLLDIYPAHPGHILVIPREPVDHIFDLEPHRYLQLAAIAQLAAHRINEVLKPQRVMHLVSGYDVPHVHLHLLPSYERGDTEAALQDRSGTPASDEELDAMQQRLCFPEALCELANYQLDLLDGLDLHTTERVRRAVSGKSFEN